MSQPPRNRPPVSRVVTTSSPKAPPPRRPQTTNVNEPRRTDPFPIVLGAIIGALVVGLMVVVYLISASGGINNNTVSSTTNNTGNAAGALATTAAQPPPASNDAASANASPTEEPPPRIPLADFKKLYDDPAKRPLIIDVRAKEAYDAGHILGAESFPESDVDTRIKELPKDKLIIAYCQ